MLEVLVQIQSGVEDGYRVCSHTFGTNHKARILCGSLKDTRYPLFGVAKMCDRTHTY